MTTVLVLDAENKTALAAIRSLGAHGVRVISGSHRRLPRGGFSKYSAGRVAYPAPDENPDEFVARIVEVVRELGADVVLPIGDSTTRSLSRRKDAISPHAATCLADWEVMRLACFKQNIFPVAARLGIPTPRMYASAADVTRFPVVVKKNTGAGNVRYVNSAAELASTDVSDTVIQEYVPGGGYGFFALFDHGRERAIFMHRRIREYPVTGGASTAAESYYDAQLRELGLTLLRGLDWHGVAMVEFKKDRRDGQYKLMEVNPKFWGSLDLAIAAGVDFPWLTVKAALGDFDATASDYRVGLRFQWVFDDLLHVAARPSSLRAVLRDFRDRGVEHDLRLSDFKPSAFEAGKTTVALIRRAATRRLRHPHGHPHATDNGA
jgi:predicted ATP-grasp superfamily ATP-dependent carboligase